MIFWKNGGGGNKMGVLIIGQSESFSDVGEIRVWWRANFQSGYRVLKKVF